MPSGRLSSNLKYANPGVPRNFIMANTNHRSIIRNHVFHYNMNISVTSVVTWTKLDRSPNSIDCSNLILCFILNIFGIFFPFVTEQVIILTFSSSLSFPFFLFFLFGVITELGLCDGKGELMFQILRVFSYPLN